MIIDAKDRSQNLPVGQFTLDTKTGEVREPIRRIETKIDMKSIRIHGRSRLEKQFKGMSEIWMTVYVQNIEFIPLLIEVHGIKKLRVILGKSMSLAWKKTHDVELFEKLAKWQIDGTLEVRVATNNWDMHEKWNLCWNEDRNHFVEINGSPNPTNTGSGATGKQSNRVTRIDIIGDYESNSYYQSLVKEWEWYVENSEEFLGSLLELLENEPEIEWRPKIVKWIESDGESDAADPIEVLTIQQELAYGAHVSSVKGQTTYRMVIDDKNDASVEKAVQTLHSLNMGVERRGTELVIPVTSLDVESRIMGAFPMMSIVDGKVWSRNGSRNICRTSDDLDPEAINRCLKMFEEYVETIQLSDSPNHKTAMMGLAEYLLAGWCAPFDHLYMRVRRMRRKRTQVGPQMTSFVGKAGNGKTYACKYLLKSLNGVDVVPLSSKDFTKAKAETLVRLGSIHPLIFDDLERKRFGKAEWESWGKAFWDVLYRDGAPHPQIVVTANDRRDLGGPLGRRVREIVMHASFSDTDENGDLVEMHLDRDNDIFLYLSNLILADYESSTPTYSHNDSLAIIRKAFIDMYHISKRKVPEWFPRINIEKAYDENANQWLDMINKKICTIKQVQNEVIAYFDANSHSSEIGGHKKLLPTQVAADQSGTKIRIKNPERFKEWLGGAADGYSGKIKWSLRRFLKD
ncbi:hypothetical protein OAV27_01160 [Euryarchaeota archaeon]|nr:hypothetical protein [Euryarchaeota archaeon]